MGTSEFAWNKVYADSISICHVDSSLIPTKASHFDLGTSKLAWNKVYADSISVCHVDSSLIPTKASHFDLGTSEFAWNNVYTTNGTVQTSDKRLKTNIKPLEKALDKVLTLNGVTYEWRVKEFPNKNFDSNRHVGVLAQELEAVLPEAVETGADGYKSVNYSNITPLLIEAMKEQQQIIDSQQAKIDNQQQIDELKRMVEELMKK